MPTNHDSNIEMADVLIVDDEGANLQLLSELLVRAGYQVRPTDDPQMAIDFALEQPPKLILLDVRMPQMDGFEVCERLKQDDRTRDIPIIFISALQDVEDRVRGFNVGGVDFISKPFQDSEVLVRVKTHLELRGMQLHLEDLVAKRTAEVIEKEQRFRATFDQAAVGIAHVSPEGRFLLINKKFCDIVGYSEDEMLDLTFKDITHPDDLEADLEYVRQVLNGEIETYSMDKRYYRKDASIVWVNLTVYVVFERGGSPNYFVSVIKDITERKRVTDELAKSEAKFRGLVDNSIIGVFNSTIDGRFKFVNDAMVGMFGFETPHQMIAQKSLERWSDTGDRNRMLTELQQYGKVTDFEAAAITRTGRKIYVIVSARQIGNDIIGMVMDITKRRQAEKALHQNRDFLAHLISAVPDAIYSIKIPERTINWANDSFNVMGYEPEEYIGESTEKYYAAQEYYEEVGRLQRDAIRKGDDLVRAEIMARRKDGRVIPAELRATFYREEGKVSLITAFIRDISERKQAEEKIIEYQRRLKTMAYRLTIAEEKERRAIAASLHDNVGQSLALARMQIASARKFTSDSKLADMLDDMSDTLLKCIKDTKQLLYELSSPTMHKMGLSSAISEWLKVQIEGKHDLKTEFINNIIDNRRKTLDPDVRTILFRNAKELVINVIKHARANKVSVRLEDRSPSIRIIVEDDGIGFDPRIVTQAGSKTSGFGLFSVEELMFDLGGSLKIVSKPGKGCTAILSAPFIINDSRGRV